MPIFYAASLVFFYVTALFKAKIITYVHDASEQVGRPLIFAVISV
jgi:tellurite resistance protein TehA-like permease